MVWSGELLECNGEADHVHLLLSLPPTVALSDFVNALKTGTSRRLRAEFAEDVKRHYWKPVLWSRSYCVLSVGGAPLSVTQGVYREPRGRELSAVGRATSHQAALGRSPRAGTHGRKINTNFLAALG